MKNVSLSILIVNCKDYKPAYNWYFCKKERYFCGTANDPDDICYDESRLNKYESSDDYVLLPNCCGMADDEAAEIVKAWCECNGIPYIDDTDSIEKAYQWYYKYGDYMATDDEESLYIWHNVSTFPECASN